MSLIPNTPYEVLRFSNPLLKPVVPVLLWAVERLGLWKTPRQGSASDITQMGVLDNLYWVHKSKNLVRLPEAELQTSDFITAGQAQISPAGSDEAQTVALSFVGDILRCHRADVVPDEVYAEVADLLSASDITIANYESPVTTQPLVDEVIGDAGPPTECASEAQFDALTRFGGRQFDLLNLANNHILDMGAEGVETTLSVLEARGIQQVGIHEARADPVRVKTLERNGITIGFASCTFGTNGHSLPENSAREVLVANLSSKHEAPDTGLLKQQITEARQSGCDLIVAIIHWGYEFEMFPRRAQQEAAQDLAEFGADLIMCHHPHVAQPVELYRTREGDRTVPIAYSLGSLLWGFGHEAIARSLVLQVSVEKTAERARITDLEIVPVRARAYAVDGQVFQKVERCSASVGR
ncbi:CapA family protein [Dinoroseobacter sp. S76]|uniref:CapA family protein n=1 Tax=Dinoroseobacter sp. S76 TaxID=3415124 RepID=UPI003C7B3AB2